jgi:oligopeptide/dipeptide ABC transporter ATP-binding protein
MTNPKYVLQAKDLTKQFASHQSIISRIRGEKSLVVPAVDGVSLGLREAETLGLVGESGCGKSTLGRTLVGLYRQTSGDIELFGKRIEGARTLEERRAVQMIFQDPFASLNPRISVGNMLSEILSFHNLVPKNRIEARSKELLALVGLPSNSLNSYPRQFSGGQRQRIGIARALALEPKILIADEAVSALDVSVQASIVNLLLDLKRDLGLTMLFISHDIAVVRQISERVAVMYLGRIVEDGTADQIFESPSHPYTKLLLQSVPKMTPGSAVFDAPPGELPSLTQSFVGCRFRSRCPVSIPACAEIDPALEPVDASEHDAFAHSAACLLVGANKY